jgi:uncharacterized ferritin-like protein (DUF455 family)
MAAIPGERAAFGAQVEAPARGTLERWCWDFVRDDELGSKCAPPAAPAPREAASWEHDPPPRRLLAPGRPRELRVESRAARTPRGAALRRDEVRARLVHTFLHHELQAAELFAWAVLAFPAEPRAFRAGLVTLCREELAHLELYAAHLGRLGFAFGDFPVRDWFWERVPRCPDALAFVALQGLGLEGANLEHSRRFAELFRAAGDEAGAAVLERVEREEIAHVAFAHTWFERLSGSPLSYESWRDRLPPPLTPALLRGRPLNRRARERAGFDRAFLDRLEREVPTTERSPR